MFDTLWAIILLQEKPNTFDWWNTIYVSLLILLMLKKNTRYNETWNKVIQRNEVLLIELHD